MSNTDVNVVMRSDLKDADFTFDGNKIGVNFPAQPTGIITEMVLVPAEKKLKYKEDGTPKEADLSFLAVDISTASASFDARTTTLTIAQTNGGPDVTVNLAELVSITVANDADKAVTLTGTGTTTDPLKADVKVKAGAENLLVKTNGELEVPKAQVKTAATEATKEHLATLNTVTIKNAFGTETIGKFYVAP